MRILPNLLPVLALVVACGAPQLKQPADVVLSMHDLDCAECGYRAVKDLTGQPGIARAEFDRKTAEVHVHFDSAVTHPGKMLARLKADALEATIGPGKGGYIPEAEMPAGSDVAWVSHGEAFDLKTAAVKGKITIVDFGAKWCGPCHALENDLAVLLQERKDIALRKVDTIDWDSPVAVQHLKDAQGLPYVVIFGPGGEQLIAKAGATIADVRAAIATVK